MTAIFLFPKILVVNNIIYGRELDEVDRVFTAVMQMAAAGEVKIDLGHPLGDHTILEAAD